MGRLFLFFTLLLGVFPATNLAGLALPMQYILLPIFLYIVIFMFFARVKVPVKSKPFLYLWVTIILVVLFSGIMNPLLELNKFNFPTEVANYAARFIFFGAFIYLLNKYKIDLKKFMGIFIFVLLLGMMVGVLQFFNWGGSDFFRNAYSFGEQHLRVMSYDNPSSRRISGVGNFATATGGFAAFTMVIILAKYFFHEEKKKTTVLGLFLVLFNVITSQARMGYLTIIFALFALYFVYNTTFKSGTRWLKSTVLFSSVSVLVGFSIYNLYKDGNPFITRTFYRWEVLGKELKEGGNRLDQIKPALAQIDNPFHFFFGISRGVEETIPDLWIEIEPLSIFVLYGAIGFALVYSLVFLLVRYFYRNIKSVKDKPALLAMTVASFVGLLSYLFFSNAYWFFREVYVGLYPWILMGATIGAIERSKRHPEEFTFERTPSKVRKRKKIRLV